MQPQPTFEPVIPAAILTKNLYRQLSERGFLGNVFRSWPTLEALQADGYSGHLTIRNRIPMGPMVTWSHADTVFADMATLVNERGARVQDLYFQEVSSPGTARLLNFEAQRSEDYLWVTPGALPPDSNQSLRQDLVENGRLIEGPAAYFFLKAQLGDDYEALDELWDVHPDSVVEATLYSRRVGTLNRRLIIWECRNY